MVPPFKKRDIFELYFSFSLFACYCDFIVISEKEKVISLTALGYRNLHGK